MDFDYSWIYLIFFLAIPLARIIPRLLSKVGVGGGNSSSNRSSSYTNQEKQYKSGFEKYSKKYQTEREPVVESEPAVESEPETERKLTTESKPHTKNDLVLGALNRGSKTFASIQKNTGFDSDELETILENLEKKGLLKIVQRPGLFGSKTELYPTDKGFKEYYS